MSFDLGSMLRQMGLPSEMAGMALGKLDHASIKDVLLEENGDGPVTVALFDIDGFKAVNDTGGHAAGDEVLASLARIFMRTVRANEQMYRIGGDEFAVVIAGATRAVHAQQGPGAGAADIEVRRVRPGFFMLVGAGGNIGAQVGDDGVILVDAAARDGEPGALYAIEPDPGALEAGPLGTHGVDLPSVFRLVRALGGTLPPLYLVGCEPAELGPDGAVVLAGHRRGFWQPPRRLGWKREPPRGKTLGTAPASLGSDSAKCSPGMGPNRLRVAKRVGARRSADRFPARSAVPRVVR